MSQVPDELVQSLLEEIGSTGRIYAKAKARCAGLIELRKITKNTLMKMARVSGDARSKEAAEVYAYTHPQYKLVSDQMIESIEDEVNAQTDNENAIREWESWRTLCANERNITRS